MGEVSKYAKLDLTTVGRDDVKACTSISCLCQGILDGIYQLRHISIVSVMLEWCEAGVASVVLKTAVESVCAEFENKVNSGDYEPKSPIADLLIERKLPRLPSTLICNDYVDIESLRHLLRRYFDEVR